MAGRRGGAGSVQGAGRPLLRRAGICGRAVHRPAAASEGQATAMGRRHRPPSSREAVAYRCGHGCAPRHRDQHLASGSPADRCEPRPESRSGRAIRRPRSQAERSGTRARSTICPGILVGAGPLRSVPSFVAIRGSSPGTPMSDRTRGLGQRTGAKSWWSTAKLVGAAPTRCGPGDLGGSSRRIRSSPSSTVRGGGPYRSAWRIPSRWMSCAVLGHTSASADSPY